MNKFHNLIETILNKGFTYTDKSRDIKRIQIPHYTFIHDFKDGFPAITTKKLYWKGVVGELIWFLRGDTNIKYLVDNGINIWNKDAYNYYLSKRWDNTKAMSFEKFILEIKTRNRDNGLGKLGRVYGAQWRSWKGSFRNDYTVEDHERPYYIDQIFKLIRGLKENPMGTKHIVTAWNPAELDDMALPPCHWSFEILVEPLSVKEQGKLHPEMWDMFLKAKLGDQWEEKVNKLGLPRYKFTLKWHQRSVDTFLGR